MKIAKVCKDNRVAQAIIHGEYVHIIGHWQDGAPEDVSFPLSRQLTTDIAKLKAGASESVALNDIGFAAPVDPTAKILCVGMNYRDHVSEIKQTVAEYPTIFQRYADTFVGHEANILRPHTSETFDYEGEITVVIGKPGRYISAETALDHVGGYTILMDGSVRQYQRHSLTAGKNYYHSGAIGPWIVPASALHGKDPLLETRLNGHVMQSARASQMIFDIAHIIAYCSSFTPLRPGDMIATGTPGGVGSRREPPVWMKAGDRLEVSVEGIGTLANNVTDEA